MTHFTRDRVETQKTRTARSTRTSGRKQQQIVQIFPMILTVWLRKPSSRHIQLTEKIDIDSAPIPFESQFFHDDVDDAFVDDTLGGPVTNGDGDAGDLWQGTQGQELKKSRPENVNFAKKAKRVDVKRLKDDIWSGLRTLVPDEKGSDGEMVSAGT